MTVEQIFDDQKFIDILLPKIIEPHHYDLTFRPNLEKFTFDGSVRIHFEASQSTREIVIHSLNLSISKGHVYHEEDKDDNTNSLIKVTYSKKSETATLEFSNSISLGAGSLYLEFNGNLSDDMCGFYRTSFKLNNNTIFAATTQFAPTYARRCFPCWDEPAIKATFSVTLTYQRATKTNDNHTYTNIALSNTPSIGEQDHTDEYGTRTTKFARTPLMSTYLLAMVVGPFEMIEASDGKRQHRVFTSPGKQEQGRFALEVSCKALTFYEKYFDIDYPLAKLDLVAVPDFGFGAMENWGLVTYRENRLLVDSLNSSPAVKQDVASVVAHELAHQWFGNLVTMEWWTHLWLNEGFATFMQYLCVDHILPEYDIWSQFASNAHARATSLDALKHSHPIEVPINDPSEIDGIFDEISYRKGASIIRMLYQYIGDDNFRTGMHNYLTKYAYANAITENLWESLEETSKKPVCRLMSGWTSQKGFPWLSIVHLEQVDESTLKMSLRQSKFTANGILPAEEADSIWSIPLDAMIDGSQRVDLGLFEGRENVVTIKGATRDGWVMLNVGNIGFYRVAYPREMLSKMLPAIKAQTLPPIDRFNLQNDLFALCQAGKVETTELLKLLEVYKGETSYTVWKSMNDCIGRLSLLLSHTNYYSKFRLFGRNIYSEIFKKVTWSPQDKTEKHTDSMIRPLVIDRLVSFGEGGVIEESKKRFKAHLDGVTLIPADLRGAIYKAISGYGDDVSFNGLFDLYRSTTMQEEKNRICGALGCTKDPERIRRVVNFALSDEVRNQDKVQLIGRIGDASMGWKLLQEHKDTFIRIFQFRHLLNQLVKVCTEHLATEEKAQEVSKFFEQNPFPACERTIQQSLETIRLNASWLRRDSEAIEAYLSM